MSTILFAFVTFLTWGTGDIFTAIAARKLGSYSSSFYGYSVGLVFFLFFIPFAIQSLHNYSVPMIFLTVVLAIIQLLGFYAYNAGLHVGNASLVGTISGSFTAFVVILSVIFFRERLITQQIIAIIVIFIGLFFASLNFSDFKKKHAMLNKGTLYAFIAMIGWAVYFTFIKIPVKASGFFWPTFVTDLVGTSVFFIFGFKKIKVPSISLHSGFVAILLEGVLLTGGS